MTTSVLEREEELLDIENIGNSLYTSFLEDRKTGGVASLWDPLKKRKLMIFKTASKSINIKMKDKVVKLKEERNLMTRLLVISRTRPDINIAEMLSAHEFSVVPRSLFDQFGIPIQCRDKSSFLHGLEEMATGVETSTSLRDGMSKCAIIDGMGLVHQLKITQSITTVEDLAKHFCDRLRTLVSSPLPAVIVLIFDSYSKSMENIKSQTWESRNKKQIRYNLTLKTKIKGLKMRDLLSHPDNKRSLTEIFGRVFVEKADESLYVVMYGFHIISNIHGWNIMSHSHFEADTLITCTIDEIVRLPKIEVGLNDYWFQIISPDTDVVILSCNFLALFDCDLHIDFKLITSKEPHLFSVNSIVSALGHNKSMGLLGVYVLTGCDHVGSFNTITKARCLKVFQNLDESNDADIISALKSIGHAQTLTDSQVAALSRFVLILYCSKRKDDKVRFSSIYDIGALRWEFYSKHQSEADQLPPTPSALKFHLLRSNFVALMWNRASACFSPNIPTIGPEYGWNIENGQLTAIMTDMLPAPEFSLELSSCACKKTKCDSKQCSC